MAMHLIKSLFSGTLVACSLIWLVIQHLFLPQELLKSWLIERHQDNVDFLQLERDWCRVRSKMVTWREMIEPCQEKSLFLLDSRFIFVFSTINSTITSQTWFLQEIKL